MCGGVDAECAELMARVASAAEEDGGVAAVDIGRTHVDLQRAVARVVVAPDSLILGVGGVEHVLSLALLESRQGERLGGEAVARAVPSVGLARLTVEVEQVFASVAGVLESRRIVVHVADVDGAARGRVDDHVVGGAHQHLGASVLVPVVADHVPLLVRTGHEVGPQVDPPEARAVHLVALVEVEVGLVALAGQVALHVVALDDELDDAVAVNVGQGDIVQDIARRIAIAVGHGVADGLARAVDHGQHGHRQVLLRPGLHPVRQALRLAAHDGLHLIGRRSLARGIEEVGLGQVGGDEGAVTIEVVFRIVVFFAHQSP